MNTITFQSSSKSKLNQLVKLAKDMGIEPVKDHELTDEEMALPGPKVSQKRLEEWLAKDDGEAVDAKEAFAYIKKQLAKTRTKK
jgi:hypothetical protein